jgi:hypothetical protein
MNISCKYLHITKSLLSIDLTTGKTKFPVLTGNGKQKDQDENGFVVVRRVRQDSCQWQEVTGKP